MSDDSQRRAAISTAKNLLVIAPPGCGKTELLALRARELIPRLQPNQKILVLTFANHAKANLSERLRRLLGVHCFWRYVRVHNFHGHAAEIILSHGETVGIQLAGLGMPTRKTLKKALQKFSSDFDANNSAARLLAEVKRTPLSDDEVIAALEASGDELARRVEVERVNTNQLHYEDLLRHAQRILIIDEVANLYHQHYSAVLVDEFQDLSLQQLDVAIRSCTASRTFAGDPLQGIYSWAGAAPRDVERKLRAWCKEPIQLTISYRSSPAVLAMLNGVSARIGAKPLRAHELAAWPGGGASAAIEFDCLQDEAQFIRRFSQRIMEADPAASVGVIVRSGWRRGNIDKLFTGPPSLPCRRWELAIEDATILDLLRSAVTRLPRNIGFEQARQKVVAGIEPSDVDTIEQVDDAFEKLKASEVGSVRAALNQFRTRDDNAAVGPGIHLLNAHSGKGQQFDWVFVPGLEEKHLPDKRSSSGEALAEEERVLLVMLSRARHGIVVTKATMLDGRYGPYRSTRSRWWKGLADSATMDIGALESHLDEIYAHKSR
jgi:DNA helicase-2/ATP-dependent DNA helicase PcrA